MNTKKENVNTSAPQLKNNTNPFSWLKFPQMMANWLHMYVNGLSAYAKKTLLLATGISIAGACFWIIFSAVSGESNSYFFIDKMTMPESLYKNNEMKPDPGRRSEHWQQQLLYLDSLNQLKMGKIQYDSSHLFLPENQF